MRIGIDCRLWRETGVGRYIRNLVSELKELDEVNSYILFVLASDYESIKYKVLGIKYKNWEVVIVDIRWHSVEEQVKFPQILYKEKLDLMHFPYFSVPVFYKRPYVVTIHDLIVHHFPTGKASTLPAPVYKLKHLGYAYVSSQAVKRAKKIIVPLETVKEDLVRTLRVPIEKIVVTHEGVDTGISNFQFPISNVKPKKQDYFLYVGNAYPHKNLERLIEAFSQVAGHPERSEGSLDSSALPQNDIRLILVGKDDFFYGRLREKVEGMNLSQSIIFRHDVSDGELSGLYANAIALISPSLMEGFGLPPLEAMALSCPVMLADIPSFREVCGNAAFYFNHHSVQAIREKIEHVYGITERTRTEHIKRGLERVKDFSWEKMAKETLEVYESSISLR